MNLKWVKLPMSGAWVLFYKDAYFMAIVNEVGGNGNVKFGNRNYYFRFDGEFDQEWRDQIQAMVEEDLTSAV